VSRKKGDLVPLRHLAQEAWRNVVARKSRLYLPLALGIALATGVGLVVRADENRLRGTVASLQRGGWNVAEFSTANDRGSIAPQSCERLVDRGAIERAGVVEYGPVYARVPYTVVSPELIGMQDDLRDWGGPIAFVDGSSNVDGRLLRLDGDSIYMGRTGATLPEAMGIGSSIVVPGRAHGPINRCYAVILPRFRNLIDLRTLQSALVATDATLQARFLLDDPNGDVFERFRSRPTRWAPGASVIVMSAVLAVVLRARASEIGTYVVSGFGRMPIVVISMIESSLVLATHLALLAVTFVVLGVEAHVASAAISIAALGVVAGLGLCAAQAVWMLRTPVFDLLKDR
jgi:hypothetical protein